jgi:hypothetical protein
MNIYPFSFYRAIWFTYRGQQNKETVETYICVPISIPSQDPSVPALKDGNLNHAPIYSLKKLRKNWIRSEYFNSQNVRIARSI